MIKRTKVLIDGRWRDAGADTMTVLDPSTEEIVGTYRASSSEDLAAAVDAARRAFDHGGWAMAPLDDRLAVLERLGALVVKHQAALAGDVTAQLGSPASVAGPSHVLGVSGFIELTAKIARGFPFTEPREGDQGRVLVVREPAGVVGAIMPFNAPLMTPIMALAPALAAGCTVVLKPDQQMALLGITLAELFEEAGLPPGVLNLALGGAEVGRGLVRADGVDKITFTGSSAAGRDIAAAAGSAMKRCTLELGGKSAAIVLDDADLELAVASIVAGSVANNGQTCYGVRRVVVSRARGPELVDRLADAYAGLAVGDAHDPKTQIGPLATKAHLARVLALIDVGRAEGAEVVVGGGRPFGEQKGWFVEPTIFNSVGNSMRIAQEEIFGPVLVVETFADEHDAIAIANDSAYGLSGSVFTADVERGVDIARRIRTGTFSVNRFGVSLIAPFGGFKQSGVGRKYGPEGLAAYTELKAILLP